MNPVTSYDSANNILPLVVHASSANLGIEDDLSSSQQSRSDEVTSQAMISSDDNLSGPFNQLLEEIKNNQFTSTVLDLSESSLLCHDRNRRILLLVEALNANKHITKLYIRECNLDAEDAKALATNKTLTSLDAAGNRIGPEGAKALAANQTLRSLNVADNELGDKGAQAFQTNQTLISLNAAGNRIGPQGAIALAANKTLTSLIVGDNHIGPKGARALAANKTLTSLNVVSNRIGFKGARAFVKKNQTLVSLFISEKRLFSRLSASLLNEIKNTVKRNARVRQAWASLGVVRLALKTEESILRYSIMDLTPHIISYMSGNDGQQFKFDRERINLLLDTGFFKKILTDQGSPQKTEFPNRGRRIRKRKIIGKQIGQRNCKPICTMSRQSHYLSPVYLDSIIRIFHPD